MRRRYTDCFRRCAGRLLYRAAAFTVALAATLCFAACTRAAPHAPQIPAAFSAEVEVTRGDFVYGAVLARADGVEILRFTAPKTLDGLCAVRTADGCTLSAKDVTATLPEDGLFLPFALFDAPEGCLAESRRADGLTVYAGQCGGDVYSIAVDDAGMPVQLSGRVGGEAAEIRVRRFSQAVAPALEKGNAHE